MDSDLLPVQLVLLADSFSIREIQRFLFAYRFQSFESIHDILPQKIEMIEH